MRSGVLEVMARQTVWLLALWPWLGCGSGLGECDMNALTLTSAGGQPYEGQQLIHQRCASGQCHSEAAEGKARKGAPADFNFDLVVADTSPAELAKVSRGEATVDEYAEEMWEWIDDGMMPPEGQRMPLQGAQKESVRNWLACGAPVIKQPITSAGADWSQIFPVLESTCGACHSAGSAMGAWLVMGDACATRANLVAKMASGPLCGPTAPTLIVANSPDTSLILSKLEAMMPTCGGVMPPDRSAAAPSTLAPSLRQWIAAGALAPSCM